MNNYVANSSYNYYQSSYFPNFRDRRYTFFMTQRPTIMNAGLSGLLAYGLQSIGMPQTVVNLGYRFGYFIDANV
ncbi:unnamed protein product [Adineta steineri]|uniref:Uncharacterized protein n=1 Tax=Adineta steineri TaxID=433720 RepID=A0A819AGM1_9BILA|nr:unnamed protein product [Adineta steineri]CAF3783405.1 unnamed protein product [Adineta steineri]